MDGATITRSSDSTTWAPYEGEQTVSEEFANEEEMSEKERIQQKYDDLGLGVPTTFTDMDEIREEQKRAMNVQKLLSDFMALVGNVMHFPSKAGTVADLKELVSELETRLPEELEEEDDSAKMTKTSGHLVTIWKDESTGTYRWLGIYSNKFRDDDNPAEILAENAHLRFIEQVEKGELAYPDLYVWHIPVAVGKSDLLAYDDAGFSIAAGEIEEDFALALMNTSHDLAMSHGMPAKSIRRDNEDRSVITEYVSTEVSILPRFAAANKMTEFYVLNEEESKMAIIPDEKRQQVANLLGNDLTEQLEAGLALSSDKALAEGIEFKEETEPVEDAETEAEEEVTGDQEEKTEEPVTEEPETAEEPVAESTEDLAEETAEEEESEVEPEEASPEEESEETSLEVPVNKGELTEALAFIVTSMQEQTSAVLEAVKGLETRVEAIEGEAGVAKESDEERVAQLAASTPEASLISLLSGRLGSQPAQSVIGNPVTRIHGNNSLAKEAPEQTEADAEEEGGLFFNEWQ
jgi:hypothetical protein